MLVRLASGHLRKTCRIWQGSRPRGCPRELGLGRHSRAWHRLPDPRSSVTTTDFLLGGSQPITVTPPYAFVRPSVRDAGVLPGGSTLEMCQVKAKLPQTDAKRK